MRRRGYFLFLCIAIFGCGGGYEIHDGKVYYKYWNESQGTVMRLLEDADPGTFQNLSNKMYGKDNESVYFKGMKIVGAHAISFKIVKKWYAIDKNKAYYRQSLIKNSSSKDFEVLAPGYSKDYKDVYYNCEPLNVCSVKDFRFVYSDEEGELKRWSTDGCFYYINQHRIPSNDYENIVLYKGVKGFSGSAGIAKDRKNVYFENRNILFNEEGKRIMDTVDVATFEVNGYLDCKDKFGCINVYHGREQCD